MRKVKYLAAVVVVTVAAVAIGLWLARDQPRRIVQAALAERLGAEVSVGSLHIESLNSVRLRDVEIRLHDAPGLQVIRIAEIIARGAVGEMSGGRFQFLQLAGVEVIVDPAAGAVWPTAVGPQITLEAARLEIAAGHLTVLSPEGDSVVEFSAEFDDIGLVPVGTLRFTGDRLQLDPVLRLAGVSAPDGSSRIRAASLVGELHVAADKPRLQLGVQVEGISAPDWPALAAAKLEVTAVEEAPGVFHLEAVPSLASVAEARIEATLAMSPWRVTWLRAVVNQLDATAVWLPPGDLPAGWSVVGGTIDLEVGGDPASGLAVDVAAHDLDIAGSLPLRANLAGKGELRIGDHEAPAGRFELSGRLARPPSETTPDVMLDALLPTTLAASVELAAGGRSLSGSGRVATAAAGTLDVVGSAGIEAPAPLDARWSWSGGDLGNLLNRLAPDAAAAIAGNLVVAGKVAAHGRLGGEHQVADGRWRGGGSGSRRFPGRSGFRRCRRVADPRRTPGRAFRLDRGSPDGRDQRARDATDGHGRPSRPGAGCRPGGRVPWTRQAAGPGYDRWSSTPAVWAPLGSRQPGKRHRPRSPGWRCGSTT